MSRKGGWYDKDDDYYDHDDDDDYDDDYDDGFGAYDTGSLAPKAKGAKGGGGQASGAKGAKGGTVGDKGGSAQSRPSKPTSAMAKQMGSTPKEKGVVPPSGGAPPGYPARPDPSTRASAGGKPPPPGFDFATPSPDEAVMAKRVKPTGGTVPGFASLSLDDGRSSSTAVAQKPPPSRPVHEYVPSDDELAHASNAKRDMHVVVLGHVDAGKSTLMGRVLHLVGVVDAKQLRRNEKDAAALGKSSFAWAFALDTAETERARGVTVDVAQARFVTPVTPMRPEPTRVTLLDAPGHRDFVGNAIAGAARADAAVLVVDAAPGGFETGFGDASSVSSNGTGGKERRIGGSVGVGQTREHVRLARSLGVSHVIVAVSKMDTRGYSEERFEFIKKTLEPFLAKSGFGPGHVSWVPVSGFEGVNLVPGECAIPVPSALSEWWSGGTLTECIDDVPSVDRGAPRPFRMPIADVIPNGTSRTLGQAAIGGKIACGSVRKGDRVLVMPAGVVARVKAVEFPVGDGDGAGRAENVGHAGDACDVGLEDVDPAHLAPGGCLCHVDFPVTVAAGVRAKIVTTESVRVPLLVGSRAVVHSNSYAAECTISSIVCKLDPATGEPVVGGTAPRCLTRNQGAVVELAFGDRPMCCESYDVVPCMGRVALRRDGATIAVGTIQEAWPAEDEP